MIKNVRMYMNKKCESGMILSVTLSISVFNLYIVEYVLNYSYLLFTKILSI